MEWLNCELELGIYAGYVVGNRKVFALELHYGLFLRSFILSKNLVPGPTIFPQPLPQMGCGSPLAVGDFAFPMAHTAAEVVRAWIGRLMDQCDLSEASHDYEREIYEISLRLESLDMIAYLSRSLSSCEPLTPTNSRYCQMRTALGKARKSLFDLAWGLHDRGRTAICSSLGVATALLVNRLLGWTWQLSFLCGLIMAMGSELILRSIVFFSADGPMTRDRVSQDEPNQKALMVSIISLSIIATGTVGQVLTAVSKHPKGQARILLILSVVAVLLSWAVLHTVFGVHYARLYYEAKDIHGRPFKEGRRSGFHFPGTETPNYIDFLYVSFTVALTYSMSDVVVENPLMRRTVLIHSLVSFFFYSTALAGLLNAILTS